MLSWLNFKPEQFATILKFQEKRLLSSNNVTSHIVALFTTWCLSQTGVSQPLVLWQSVGFSAGHQNVLILFDFLCRLFACTVKPGDFFSLHVAFQRFLNECIKFAVTCSVRAKFWSLPSWVTSAWSPSSSTKTVHFSRECHVVFWKTLQHTICHKMSVKTCPFDFTFRQLINQQHAENGQGKHQASIWWAEKPKTVPQWWQPTHLSVWQKATTYQRHVSIACLSFITALTKETDDEEKWLLTFIALLMWLKTIAFFIQSFQVWLLKILSLSAGFTVTLQAIMACGIRLLLCCFENHHACLVSSWADIVTVAAFWTNLFYDCCFDSQLAWAIVIMLVSGTANFTLFSLFIAHRVLRGFSEP